MFTNQKTTRDTLNFKGFDEESQMKIDINQIKLDDNKNDIAKMCCASCCGCGGIVLLFSIALGYITWLVFAIKAISNTSNQDIKDICNKSDIWPLALTIIIVSGCTMLTSILSSKKEEEEENNNGSKIISFCLQLALVIWCGIELNTSCAQNNLDDENIYILLTYWFYFGCVSLGLTLIMLGCYLCALMSTNE